MNSEALKLADTLKLIALHDRRCPSRKLHRRLDALLRMLRDIETASVADRVADDVWTHWMRYPDDRAAAELERATRAITAGDYPTAERILHRLIRLHPEFPEAWHKRAVVYYLQERDAESIRDLHRTLELEPRHFGAILSFAEICLAHDARDAALFAFDVALTLNPHLSQIRDRAARLLVEPGGRAH